MALAADGFLWMLDKFGYVWRAPEDGKGSYAMESRPIAQLGPGRPLGFDFDEEGNLIVCNSGSVRCKMPVPMPVPMPMPSILTSFIFRSILAGNAGLPSPGSCSGV